MDVKHNPPAKFKNTGDLTEAEAAREAADLREGIEYHDYQYYVKNDPKISDARYDKLFHRLQALEAAFPKLQAQDSPTMRVGAGLVDKLEKVDHTAPMLSLNAALEEKEIRRFYDYIRQRVDEEKMNFVLEPKFDGFSVELVYEDGALKYGATRGDGRTGEDITRNLKTIHAVPIHLPRNKDRPEFVAVRGEVFMPKKAFQELNRRRIENGREPFANPRNAAAGVMRQLDPGKVADKPLDVIFYEILQVRKNEPQSHWAALTQFPVWGFKTDSHNRKGASFEDIKTYHEKMAEQRDGFDYDIDGVVVKLDSYEQRQRLGVRQRSPRWAFAWKFPPKEEVTRLEDIVVQVGRTGMLTPVALLESVDVGGVTVSQATLHNEDETRKKDVRPGDRVRIVRAGDVIPEVMERVKEPGRKRGKPFSMPAECPACGADIYRDGAYYFCPGKLQCPPQIVGGVVHYASRRALDIKGLGDKTAADMVDKGMVGDIADLYDLTKEDLLSLDGFAEKSARQLYEAIQDTKQPPLEKFLYALGIRHVGLRIAAVLAREYGRLEEIRTAKRADLEKISEIGPQIAASLYEFFNQEKNWEVLDRLAEAGLNVRKAEKNEQSRALSGKTFVFTGELESLTRQEARDLVARQGGRATSSVSSQTDFVVAGADPGQKIDEAEKQKAKIIDERQFKDMVT